MDINALPAGEAALVDANIIIYYLGGLSADCRDFFHRVARREVEAHVTTTIIAETLHRRMMAEAVAKGLISTGQIVKKLKANLAVILHLRYLYILCTRLRQTRCLPNILDAWLLSSAPVDLNSTS